MSTEQRKCGRSKVMTMMSSYEFQVIQPSGPPHITVSLSALGPGQYGQIHQTHLIYGVVTLVLSLTTPASKRHQPMVLSAFLVLQRLCLTCIVLLVPHMPNEVELSVNRNSNMPPRGHFAPNQKKAVARKKVRKKFLFSFW